MKALLSSLLALWLLLGDAGFAHAIDRDQAAAVAQQTSGGRVLSVDRGQVGGREVFRVKVLTPQGEVRVILIDVVTGRTL